jgi:hypothetical protein
MAAGFLLPVPWGVKAGLGPGSYIKIHAGSALETFFNYNSTKNKLYEKNIHVRTLEICKIISL